MGSSAQTCRRTCASLHSLWIVWSLSIVDAQNIRVIAKYYTRITLERLGSLLDLSRQETEETLSRLVVQKTVYARIDRPAATVTFSEPKTTDKVLNEWSSDVGKLMVRPSQRAMAMDVRLRSHRPSSRRRATSSRKSMCVGFASSDWGSRALQLAQAVHQAKLTAAAAA